MNDTLDKLGTQIVDSRDIWTRRRLTQLSFCFGLAVFILLFVAIILGVLADALINFHLIREIELTLLGIAVICMACTVWAMKRCRFQFGPFFRRVLAALGAAVGVTCVPCSVMILDHSLEFARLYKSWPPIRNVAPIMLFPPGVFLLWLLFISVAWPLLESSRPFRIQEGANCPKCGYCLRGVVSRICPECGRAFTRDDLGLSEAAFDALVSAGQAESRTAAST